MEKMSPETSSESFVLRFPHLFTRPSDMIRYFAKIAL